LDYDAGPFGPRGDIHLDNLPRRRPDAGLEHLEGLTNLKWLRLYKTQVTEEGVKKLQQSLPNCTIRH